MQITVHLEDGSSRTFAHVGGWQLLGDFVIIGNDHAQPAPIAMLRAADINGIEVEGTDVPEAEPNRIVKPALAFPSVH